MKIAMTSDEGGKTMIKKLTLVFVVVSLLAAPAVLAKNGAIQGSYGNFWGGAAISEAPWLFMTVFVDETIYGFSSCVISLEDDWWNQIFHCFGDAEDCSFNIDGAVENATIEVNTNNLECFGTPPQMIAGKCTTNDTYSMQGVTTQHYKYGDGSTWKWHLLTRQTEADCAFTLDGTLYDGDATISLSKEVDKANSSW